MGSKTFRMDTEEITFQLKMTEMKNNYVIRGKEVD